MPLRGIYSLAVLPTGKSRHQAGPSQKTGSVVSEVGGARSRGGINPEKSHFWLLIWFSGCISRHPVEVPPACTSKNGDLGNRPHEPGISWGATMARRPSDFRPPPTPAICPDVLGNGPLKSCRRETCCVRSSNLAYINLDPLVEKLRSAVYRLRRHLNACRISCNDPEQNRTPQLPGSELEEIAARPDSRGRT